MARLSHLASVFAAMAASHHVERQTGWGIKRFVATTRRYRTKKSGASRQILARCRPITPTTSVMSWPRPATPLCTRPRIRVLPGQRRFRGSGSATRRQHRPYRAVAGRLHIRVATLMYVYVRRCRRRHRPSSLAGDASGLLLRVLDGLAELLEQLVVVVAGQQVARRDNQGDWPVDQLECS
jgi:hypothetical protein